ncbi:Fpg/Nei family DNA glycosylase [soil metagenome]
MPEGHTLHRLAKQQNERFADRPVRVSSPQGRFAAGARIVDSRVLERVTATGKHLFASFGDALVHVHLGLYGGFTSGPSPAPEPRGALRMRWENDDWWTDLRGAPTCEVLGPDEAATIRDRLGPDPLARRASGEAAWARISNSRAPIGVLLMDQRVVAGIGNVYRAELLFRHGIAPFRPGRELSSDEWTPLWRDVMALMRAGVRSGRIITTRPEDRPRGRVDRDDAFYVYQRAGLPCRICSTPIRTEPMADRNLFWCPTCQTM